MTIKQDNQTLLPSLVACDGLLCCLGVFLGGLSRWSRCEQNSQWLHSSIDVKLCTKGLESCSRLNLSGEGAGISFLLQLHAQAATQT